MTEDEHTSISSPASEDLPSHPHGQDSKQSASASKTSSASKSSKDIGPMCQSSMTYKHAGGQTSDPSIWSQVDFLANLSAQPDLDEARKMTARSGRKWLALYKRQDPLGYLVKTLLVSSRWESNQCLLTWRAWDLPCRRSVFQLVAKARRIEERGSGLWPSPRTTDGRGGRTLDETGRRISKSNPKQTFGANLSDMARMFPTPTADDAKNNGNSSQFKRTSNGKPRALNLNAEVVKLDQNLKAGEGVLNPTWVCWLMGYPLNWFTHSTQNRKESQGSQAQ